MSTEKFHWNHFFCLEPSGGKLFLPHPREERLDFGVGRDNRAMEVELIYPLRPLHHIIRVNVDG